VINLFFLEKGGGEINLFFLLFSFCQQQSHSKRVSLFFTITKMSPPVHMPIGLQIIKI
jgi:hypothetical protein